MQSTILSTIILSLVIFSIMMSLGLTLTLGDFRRLLDQWRLDVIGVICQFIILPLLGLRISSVRWGNNEIYP